MLVNNVDRIKNLLNLNGYNIGSNNNKSFTDHFLLEEIMDFKIGVCKFKIIMKN